MPTDQGEYAHVDAPAASLQTREVGSGWKAIFDGMSLKWKAAISVGIGVAGVAALGCIVTANAGATEEASAAAAVPQQVSPASVTADAHMQATDATSDRTLEVPSETVDPNAFGKGRSCRGADSQKGTEGKSFNAYAGVKTASDCKGKCQSAGDSCTGIEYNIKNLECRVWSEPIGGSVESKSSGCFRRKVATSAASHTSAAKTKHPAVSSTANSAAKKNHHSVSTTAKTEPKPKKSARPAKCGDRFKAPKKPKTADEHNGVALEDACFEGDGPHHAFIIGDWGGLTQGDGRLAAAPHLTHRWETNYQFIWPPDEQAQTLVRDQIRKRAPDSRPDYFLNVGDNFYWAGIEDHCGAKDITDAYSMGGTTSYKEHKVNQFDHVFEKVYTGDGIDDKQWLGVLGNHDYGGWLFTHAWDQNIGYTWSKAKYSTGRWMTPAMYYKAKVWYDEFAVDYYFLDTNIFDALDPKDPSPHNICSETHNDEKPTTCAPVGPSGVWKCQDWFGKLWKNQQKWLDEVVPESTADWRIVVTHFPPSWGAPDWKKLAPKHEIDLVIAGHRHIQDMHQPGDNRTTVWHNDPNQLYNDFVDPTVWVVSGGGGGVTSEKEPSMNGEDDQYGFMDMTLAKDKITIEGISHGGQLRRTLVMEPAFPHHPLYDEAKAKKAAEEAKEKANAWANKHAGGAKAKKVHKKGSKAEAHKKKKSSHQSTSKHGDKIQEE